MFVNCNPLGTAARWRNDTERAPGGEARLSWMEGGREGTQGGGGGPEAGDNPERGDRPERNDLPNAPNNPPPVDRGRDQTRGQVNQTLNGEGQANPQQKEAAKVLESVEATRDEMRGILEKMEELEKRGAANMLESDLRQRWHEDMNFLRDESKTMDKLARMSALLRDVESGQTSPQSLLSHLSEYYYIDPERPDNDREFDLTASDIRRAQDRVLRASGSMNPAGANASTNMEIGRAVIATAGVQNILAMMDDVNSRYKKALEESKTKDWVDKIGEAKTEEEQKNDEAAKNGTSVWRSLFRNLGVGVISWNELMGAGSDFLAAWKRSWQVKSGQRQADFAAQLGSFGGWLGWVGGGQIQDVLRFEQLNKKREEQDFYEKGMKERNDPFKRILAQLDDAVANANYNQARALLSYAAEKGYLYFIDRDWSMEPPSSRSVLGYKLGQMLGDMGETEIHQYYKKLLSAQRSGEQDARGSGEKQASSREEAALIVDDIRRELEGNNYWKVVGMIDVAMKKGKEPEISPWISAVLLRHFREDPKASKFFEKRLLEQVGNIGFGHPGFSLEKFKTQRVDIDKYLRGKVKYGDPEGSKFLAAHAAIEREVLAADPSLGADDRKQEFDRTVAKILGFHTTKVGDRYFSIFADGPGGVYKAYREEILETKYFGGINMEADADFFYDSEIVGVNAGAIEISIGAYVENGKLRYEDKFANFMRLVIDRDYEFRKLVSEGKLPPSVSAQFREEMQRKLTPFMDKILRERNSPAINISGQTKENDVFPEALKKKKIREPLFAGLYARGILDRATLDRYTDRESLGYQVRQQVRQARPPRDIRLPNAQAGAGAADPQLQNAA